MLPDVKIDVKTKKDLLLLRVSLLNVPICCLSLRSAYKRPFGALVPRLSPYIRGLWCVCLRASSRQPPTPRYALLNAIVRITGRKTSCGRLLCADRSVAETLNPGSRSHPHKKKTQRVFFMRITGLEPARDSPLEPKSSASANSAISASKHNYSKPTTIVSMLFTQSPKIVWFSSFFPLSSGNRASRRLPVSGRCSQNC